MCWSSTGELWMASSFCCIWEPDFISKKCLNVNLRKVKINSFNSYSVDQVLCLVQQFFLFLVRNFDINVQTHSISMLVFCIIYKNKK
jgi:hypothetical protein